MRLSALVLLAACGRSAATAPPPRDHAPRATAAWATGDCIPKVHDTDPCIQLTAADVSAIRTAILAYLHDARDLPDASLVQRLVEPPIAQWTTRTYAFTATTAPGQRVALALSASERIDANITAGFTCVLVRTDDGWLVVALSPSAAM